MCRKAQKCGMCFTNLSISAEPMYFMPQNLAPNVNLTIYMKTICCGQIIFEEHLYAVPLKK